MAEPAFRSFLQRWCAPEGGPGERRAAATGLRAALDTVDVTPALRTLFERVCHHAEGSASTRPGGVYVDSAGAFEIFIATGGNVGMYEAVHAALRAACSRAIRALLCALAWR